MEFIYAKKLVQTVKSDYPWFGVDYNMNIYRGCNHGCIYCDSRSSCYQVHDFDTVKVKQDAPIKVENELKSKRKNGVIGLGAMSDPYNYYEKKLKYTKDVLKSISKNQFGVFIITKSDLVIRDIDIFKSISNHSVCNVALTITTYDEELKKEIEPYSPSSSDRFDAIKELSDNGIYTGILMMPILPFINDSIENIENIVKRASEVGANYIYPYFGVTLRDNQKDYYFMNISPKLVKKYKTIYKDSYMCTSLNSKSLKKHFEMLCIKYGILYKMDDIINESKTFIKNNQISLF